MFMLDEVHKIRTRWISFSTHVFPLTCFALLAVLAPFSRFRAHAMAFSVCASTLPENATDCFETYRRHDYRTDPYARWMVITPLILWVAPVGALVYINAVHDTVLARIPPADRNNLVFRPAGRAPTQLTLTTVVGVVSMWYVAQPLAPYVHIFRTLGAAMPWWLVLEDVLGHFALHCVLWAVLCVVLSALTLLRLPALLLAGEMRAETLDPTVASELIARDCEKCGAIGRRNLQVAAGFVVYAIVAAALLATVTPLEVLRII